MFTLVPAALHAQQVLGKRSNDVVMQMGNEYTSLWDGKVTKLRYAPHTVDHPAFGTFTEYDQYDFVNDVCEARHAYIPAALEQDFIADCNRKFGHGDHLWRGADGIYIAIKEHGTTFELMTWTPAYEAVLDNR